MKTNQHWVRVFAFSPLAQPLAQAMWQSLWSSVTCIVVTIFVTFLTDPMPDEHLRGLVYGLTEKVKDEGVTLFHRPSFWGAVLIAAFVVAQILFW
jgi:SSS family solute:Na+ symporter